MSVGRVDKSVAVYASERLGNVISEAKDPCEMCRIPGGMPPNSTGSGCIACWVAVRCDCVRGCETREQGCQPHNTAEPD